MEKNALYLCCIADPWVEVARNLKSQGIIPAYIVHWKADEEKFESAFGEKCHLQAVDDAWKGLGFPSNLSPRPLDEADLKELAWYELNALKMMDRLDPLGNQFGFQERRYFFQDLVGYWLACIDTYGIDVVVSPSIPHRVFDYALYVAGKLRNLRFLMFQMVPFGSASLVIESVDEMGDIFKGGARNCTGDVPSRSVLEKIERVKSDYSKAIPSYMVAHKNRQKFSMLSLKDRVVKPLAKIILFSLLPGKDPNTYWVRKGLMPNESSYSWVYYYYTVFQRARKVRFMRKEYQRLVKVGGPKKFVLVAFHYQPEETSCPTGGSYADQINIVKLLDESLPEDVGIVVKEHKSQFYTHQESASGRDHSFYRRLKSLASDRIRFVSVDADPFELIDKAIATVTISGTIGWESAIRGTPSIVFGRAWYENMPRVHKVKSRADLEGAIKKLEAEKNRDLDQQILLYHAELESRIVKAKHYKAYLKNSDISMNDSVVNLTDAIVSSVLMKN